MTHTGTLLDTSKEFSLEVNAEKTSTVSVHISSPECKTESYVRVANKSLENVAKF
jgi:hypothetical protein